MQKNFDTMWIARSAAAATAAALLLAPLAPAAQAASYINTAVPSNPNLTSGLVLRYSFDNTKVNVKTGAVTDESGNAITGTYKRNGAAYATTTPGKIGQALSFNGITASISTASERTSRS